MGLFRRKRSGERIAPPELVAAARENPGGWVYEIDGNVVDDPNGAVPPEAIIAAWEVDAHGRLSGGYRTNPNHRPGATGR